MKLVMLHSQSSIKKHISEKEGCSENFLKNHPIQLFPSSNGKRFLPVKIINQENKDGCATLLPEYLKFLSERTLNSSYTNCAFDSSHSSFDICMSVNERKEVLCGLLDHNFSSSFPLDAIEKIAIEYVHSLQELIPKTVFLIRRLLVQADSTEIVVIDDEKGLSKRRSFRGLLSTSSLHHYGHIAFQMIRFLLFQ